MIRNRPTLVIVPENEDVVMVMVRVVVNAEKVMIMIMVIRRKKW